MKPLKTFDDGSELTVPMLAGTIVAATIGGLAIFTVKEKVGNWRMRRYCKKHNIPWNG